MPKTSPHKRRRRPKSGPDHFEGETADDLMRALEIDGLTAKSCIEALFGDILDELEADGVAPEGAYRVTQAGPPRRTQPEKSDDDAPAT